MYSYNVYMRVSDFKDPFCKQVISKVYYKRENCLILTTGEVQKGKTTVNVSYASKLDPDFGAHRIVWLPQDFSRMLVEQKLKRGSAILFEEVGTEAGGIPRRKWFAFNNFIINDVLQTFGFEGLIVFLSVPSMSYIDSNALKLMDYKISVKDKDIKKNLNYVQILRMQYNDEIDRIYYHRLKDKKGNSIKYFAIKRTDNKELLKHVFDEEAKYKKWIQTQGLERIEKKFREKTTDVKPIVEKLIEDFNDGKNYWKFSRGKYYLIQGLVMEDFDIGGGKFSKLKDLAYKRIEKVRDVQARGSSSKTSSV